MGFSKRVITAATIGLLALTAVPASAQRGGGGMRGGGMRGGVAVGRSVPRGGGPSMGAPRQVFAPRMTFSPRMGPTRVAPSFGAARFNGMRMAGPRTVVAGVRPAFANRSVVATRSPFVTSRGFVATRRVVAGPRRVVVVHKFVPRVIGPRIVVVPRHFVRPVFAFRPRFSLGFGLWAGFPVAYPYYYPYGYASPYPYPYPYATTYPGSSPYSTYDYQDPSYGYPATGYPARPYPTASYPATSYASSGYPAQASPGGSIELRPGQELSGVSFDITPNTAEVYVDGTNVGTVAEFSPTSMPLTLTPGRHHIEIRAAGYQTMAFDTEILVMQVIPYRGEMQPQR